MPIINIKLAAPLPSDAKLAELAGKITDLMVAELGKKRERVVVSFEAVDPAHIAFGGVTVADLARSRGCFWLSPNFVSGSVGKSSLDEPACSISVGFSSQPQKSSRDSVAKSGLESSESATTSAGNFADPTSEASSTTDSASTTAAAEHPDVLATQSCGELVGCASARAVDRTQVHRGERAQHSQQIAHESEPKPPKWRQEGTGELVRIGVVVASDRASAGEYDDRGGPGVWAAFAARCANPLEGHYRCVADERAAIASAIAELAGFCDIVATTGGTGPAARDVTPEATRDVCDRELAGFGELMRAASLRVVPTAILSRQTAACCGRALVLNLPGKPAAIEDCLAPVWPAIGYAVDLLGGARIEAAEGAPALFRPKGK